MKKIRMGLIGCGNMMSKHAKAVNEVSDQLEITAICDTDVECMNKVAEVLNDPYMTTDYRTMVDQVDAVLVALPHDLHYECGLFFARHKKHIMMEKPLCNTEEECLSLIKACEDEGVTLMCAYPVRFWPGIIKMKEIIDSGEMGAVMQMSAWTEQLTTSDELKWSATARIGGGQFFSHGCHYVDLLLWFLGNPVKGMHFGTRVGTPWLLREGTSVAAIQFENGAIGYHGATWGARGTKLGYNFQVQTEKGLLEYDHDEGELRLYDLNAEHEPGTPTKIGKEYKSLLKLEKEAIGQKQTQFEIKHFIDCVQTGKKPMTDGYSALQGLRIIWKMYDAEKHNIIADLHGLGLNQ